MMYKKVLVLFLISISFICPCYLVISGSALVNKDSIWYFNSTAPTILSILLAAVLASVSIIFGLTGVDELKLIRDIENLTGENYYNNAMKNLKWDIYTIFFSFIISSIIAVFSLYRSCIVFIGYAFNVYEMIFIFNFVFFIISSIATYDIICGLFLISEFKYSSTKKVT